MPQSEKRGTERVKSCAEYNFQLLTGDHDATPVQLTTNSIDSVYKVCAIRMYKYVHGAAEVVKVLLYVMFF